MHFYTVFLVMVSLASNATSADLFFQSPSGNIRCVLSETGVTAVRCDLEVDRQTYTNRPVSCDGEWGTSFRLGASGSGNLNCATTAIGGPADPVPLPYGAIAVFAGVSCLSEETGVTCTNADGGGFSVRRGEQRIF